MLFENLLRKLKFFPNLSKIKCSLHENVHKFVIMPRQFLLTINVSDKAFSENQTHFISNHVSENRALLDNV